MSVICSFAVAIALLERELLGFEILRLVLDDKMGRLELIEGTDCDSGRGRNSSQCMAAGYRNPFVGFGDYLLDLLDVAESTVDRLLQRLQRGLGVRPYCDDSDRLRRKECRA